jgi:hypothetical protein
MSAEYPVVAFLQNCWFKPGTNPETIRRYLAEQKFRRIVLGMSMTGRRLSTAFGEHHYRRIWWDNASEYVANTAPGRGEADSDHIRKILNQIKPSGVIAFGGIATQGLYGAMSLEQEDTEDKLRFLLEIFKEKHVHAFPHPNARGLRQSQLNEFAQEIITRYL